MANEAETAAEEIDYLAQIRELGIFSEDELAEYGLNDGTPPQAPATTTPTATATGTGGGPPAPPPGNKEPKPTPYQDYQRRIQELAAIIAQFEGTENAYRADQAREELSVISKELQAAGPGSIGEQQLTGAGLGDLSVEALIEGAQLEAPVDEELKAAQAAVLGTGVTPTYSYSQLQDLSFEDLQAGEEALSIPLLKVYLESKDAPLKGMDKTLAKWKTEAAVLMGFDERTRGATPPPEDSEERAQYDEIRERMARVLHAQNRLRGEQAAAKSAHSKLQNEAISKLNLSLDPKVIRNSIETYKAALPDYVATPAKIETEVEGVSTDQAELAELLGMPIPGEPDLASESFQGARQFVHGLKEGYQEHVEPFLRSEMENVGGSGMERAREGMKEYKDRSKPQVDALRDLFKSEEDIAAARERMQKKVAEQKYWQPGDPMPDLTEEETLTETTTSE